MTDRSSFRIAVAEEGADSLADYASIPIAYEVRSVLAIEPSVREPSGFRLTETPLDIPRVKDYDSEPRNAPLAWPSRFDIRRWGFFAARIGGQRVGGAVVIADEAAVKMVDGRTDLAILWDLRVAPGHRGRGVGGALLRAAERWARHRSTSTLKVETQNVNVPACRFYDRHDFELRAVNQGAYPDLPDEIQLLWYKPLPGGPVRKRRPAR